MTVRIINADVLEGLAQLPDASVSCCVTSPPYFGLRDYGMPGQIGLEPTPDEFVAKLVAVFREVRRVLTDDGTCWVNMGDSYAGGGSIGRNDAGRDIGGGGNKLGSGNPGPQGTRKGVSALKPKDLIGIPWRLAFALQADGWYLRQDIIWHKPNPMPESVTDRCTKAHEYIFLLTKSARYFYDAEAIAQAAVYPGDDRHNRTDTRKDIDPFCADGGSRARTGTPTGDRVNKRSVWIVATQPFSGAHFATFPPELIEPCIKAGCPKGGTVLDPFFGAGTTGLVADRLGRNAIGIELNPEYAAMAKKRIQADAGMFGEVA